MRIQTFIRSLGPGLIYAGAAVGVSHLVQSTRAGAMYGLGLLGFVILANVLKYPFFEVAPRFTLKTGKNLLHGYQSLGKFALPLFAFVTFSTLFIVVAAVTIVTGGLAAFLFGTFTAQAWSVILLISCSGLLVLGRYTALDQLMKWLVICLTLCTLIALVLSGTTAPTLSPSTFSFLEPTDLVFFIALIGWMPAPFDISVWNSMWIEEKKKDRSISNRAILTDFHVGYWGTTLLAALFLLLGAFTLYSGSAELPASATGFAQTLIGIYTDSLGQGAFYLIATAAFTTMFSTTLTVLDGFSRVAVSLTTLSLNVSPGMNRQRHWLLLIVPGSLAILFYGMSSMRQLIDFATTISFLTAPVLAAMNLLTLRKADAWWKSKLPPFIAYAGLLAITLFAVYYLISKFT